MLITLSLCSTPFTLQKCRCSSTASTSNEPGPDVADYPYDTVPNKA